MKKKMSMTLVFALVAMMALSGVAVAATMEIFGRLSDTIGNEYTTERLENLGQVAQSVGVSAHLTAPASNGDVDETAVYDLLLARQQERAFDLTIDQAYCDGKTLYVSYTFTQDSPEIVKGTGKPSGVGEWDVELPGGSTEDIWELDPQTVAWLNDHQNAYVAEDYAGVSDGVKLSDGTTLDIIEGEEAQMDENTVYGYQVVALPEGFEPGDSFEIVFSVGYGSWLYHQDETGLYAVNISQTKSKGKMEVPVTVRVNGHAQELTGSATFGAYSAAAELAISDVDLSGEVRIDAPQSWKKAYENWNNPDSAVYIRGYVLMADGVQLANLENSYFIGEDGLLHVTVRSDLPASMNNLKLVPEYNDGHQPDESECILMK